MQFNLKCQSKPTTTQNHPFSPSIIKSLTTSPKVKGSLNTSKNPNVNSSFSRKNYHKPTWNYKNKSKPTSNWANLRKSIKQNYSRCMITGNSNKLKTANLSKWWKKSSKIVNLLRKIFSTLRKNIKNCYRKRRKETSSR